MIDPDGGLFTYQYDLLDRLTAVTNPQDETTSLTLDGIGRLTRRETVEDKAIYTYDCGNRIELRSQFWPKLRRVKIWRRTYGR